MKRIRNIQVITYKPGSSDFCVGKSYALTYHIAANEVEKPRVKGRNVA